MPCVCWNPLFPSTQLRNILKPLPIKTTIRINREVSARYWYFKSSPCDSGMQPGLKKNNSKIQTMTHRSLHKLPPAYNSYPHPHILWDRATPNYLELSKSATFLASVSLHTCFPLLECPSLPSRKCPLVLSLGVISVKPSRIDPHLGVSCRWTPWFHNPLGLSLWEYLTHATLIVHLYICLLH